MRKYLWIAIIIFGITGTSVAQETATNKHMIGTSILPLFLGFANVQYGYMFDNGSKEVSVPLYYLLADENNTIFGTGVVYRAYPFNPFKGFHYGGALYYSYWWYDKMDEGGVSSNLIIPNLELGYRWTWDNGLSINLDIGYGYLFFDGKMTWSGKSTEIELPGEKFVPNLGFQFTYLLN